MHSQPRLMSPSDFRSSNSSESKNTEALRLADTPWSSKLQNCEECPLLRPTHPTIDTSSSNSISAFSLPVLLIIVLTSQRLSFDTDNVDMFFHIFEAHYCGKNLTDELLYYDLMQCLNSRQVNRVFSELKTTSLHSYALLRAALMKIYSVAMHQKFQKLQDVPALGDCTPSELLADLSSILKTIH